MNKARGRHALCVVLLMVIGILHVAGGRTENRDWNVQLWEGES